MSDKITVEVAGGCSKCGNPDICVPDDYTAETVITCKKCGYSAPHASFFEKGEG